MRTVHVGDRRVRRGAPGAPRLLLTGLAVGALLLGACGEDADDDGADDGVEDVTDADPDLDEPADDEPAEDLDDPADDPGDDPGDDPADTTGDDGDASGDGRFDDVLAELQAIEPSPTQVTYEVTYDVPQEGEQDEQMVTATDPPRTVTVMDTPEGTIHTIVDEDADEVISCFQMGEQWQCMRMTGAISQAEDLLAGQGDQLPDLTSPEFEQEPDDVSYETILDRDAVCVHYDQMGEATDVRFCLDEQTGVMLRTASDGTDGFDVEAVEFSTDPDPSLFEPPAEPMDMGDLGDLEGLEDLDLEDLDGLPGMAPDGA